MSNLDKKTELAIQLRQLGVSGDGVYQLLANFPEELIEAQLLYLPYRKAKRPEAFIVEAVRNNYSPPKEFFHAQAQTQPAAPGRAVDQDAEPRDRPARSEAQGHGASGPLGASPANDGLGQGRAGDLPDLPNLDTSDWQKE